MNKSSPLTQTIIGFNGSIQIGLRGAEPLNLAEGFTIKDVNKYN
jgi:hypothetical protein